MLYWELSASHIIFRSVSKRSIVKMSYLKVQIFGVKCFVSLIFVFQHRSFVYFGFKDKSEEYSQLIKWHMIHI